MTHQTKDFTLRIPYDTEGNEPTDDSIQELFNKMLQTYKEFGHINFDTVDEEQEVELDYMIRHKAKAFNCYGSSYLGEWNKSIKRLGAGFKTTEEALSIGKRIKDMVYDYERAMGCPIEGVNGSVVRQEDGTYNVVTKPKYNTF